MATHAAPRTRLEPDARRAQILACAQRLFSEQRYGAVSMETVAREAGVTRGLLHHYFGGKRELFLEVVRSMVHVPPSLPAAEELAGGNREEGLGAAVDRWLEVVWRNRETWLATVGAQGFGRDPELELILEEAREQTAGQLIALLRPANQRPPTRELRALVRAYAGLAEATSLEWLERRRLSREQARELLLRGILQLVGEVLPHVEAARSARTSSRQASNRNGGSTR